MITETGELLGKVRGFKFDTQDGRVESITIASIGLPQIPDQLISTYELSMEEVVSSGPDRLIVFEGAEHKIEYYSIKGKNTTESSQYLSPKDIVKVITNATPE